MRPQPFRVDAEIATADGPIDVATGRDPAGERRWLEIMGETQRGLASLADLVAIAWLTPAMDRLFLDAASERRRFLDRLVLAVYPEHGRQTAIFERTMRERSLLLRNGPRDPAWLTALEERMAATGVAVAAGRRELVSGLNTILAVPDQGSPAIRLELDGAVEGWLEAGPAIDAEERLARGLGRRPGAGRRDRWCRARAASQRSRRHRPRDRRAGAAGLDRPAEGHAARHRPRRGAAAPAGRRRPAYSPARRDHGASRPEAPRRSRRAAHRRSAARSS